MNKVNRLNNCVLVLAGIGIILSCFLLMGAYSMAPIGRYQLQVVVRRSFPDLYVIDTSTGSVKWVDSKHEGKPFEEIR